MASLNEFKSYVRSGMAKTSHFLVQINTPPGLANFEPTSSNINKINLFCDQTQIPGISYGTSQVRSYGEFKEVPYEKIYEPITMSFYIDAGMKVKNFFDQWMSVIQDPKTRNFSYPSKYITDTIKILVYDSQENQRYAVTLNRCYPKNITAIQLDYSAKDIMKMNVTFVYQFSTATLVSSSSEIQDTITDNSTTIISERIYGYNSEVPINYFNNFDAFQTQLNSYDFTFEGARSALSSFENIGENYGFGGIFRG